MCVCVCACDRVCACVYLCATVREGACARVWAHWRALEHCIAAIINDSYRVSLVVALFIAAALALNVGMRACSLTATLVPTPAPMFRFRAPKFSYL